MKIAMLHPYYHEDLVGGGETVIRQLIDFLNQKGIETEIISLGLDIDNPIHHLGLSPYLQFKVYTSIPPMMRSDIDIIHSHFSYATLPYSLLKKTLLTFHGYLFDIYLSKRVTGPKGLLRYGYYQTQKFYEYLNAVSAKRVTAVSEHVKKRLVEDMHLNEKQISVVHNGVDLGYVRNCIHESPFTDGKFNILYVGRLSYEKGPDLLLHAIMHLNLKDINVSIAGPVSIPSYKKRMEEIITAYAIKNTRFLGALSKKEVFSYMHHADIVVIPSRSEGMGMVAVEALASSACVVSSDIGALKEVLGDAAVFFRSGDFVSLREQIHKLINDPDLRKNLRARAQNRKKMFDLDKTLNSYLSIYEEMYSSK